MNLENGMTTQSASAINWIEKLATAEKDGIKQGRDRLGNQSLGFCCIGYGCHVGEISYHPRDKSSGAFQRSVGLLNINGMPLIGPSCVSMNDTKKWGFSDISAALQKDPSEYFIPSVAKSIKEHFA
jgi:hypothetical protein